MTEIAFKAKRKMSELQHFPTSKSRKRKPMINTNRLIIELRTDIVNRNPKRPLKYISIIIKFDMVSKNQFDSNPEISSNSGKC